MDAKEKLLGHIEERLTVYANWITQGGGIRSDASEDLYCDLLNTALGYDLQNMNWVEDNFPAIDLGDDDEGLAVQVTSTGTAEKVRKTLTRFYDHGLEQRYDRLIVLIAGKAECKAGKFDHPGVELEVWGTAELMQEFRRLTMKKLQEVDEFLTERMDAPRMTGPKPIHLPVNMSLGDGGFVGREKELQQMAEALAKGVKPLVIWGLGGMGKTELVSQFGRAYRGGDVYMALFREDLRQTVADSIAPGIPELKDLKLSPEQRYELTMERLRQCPAGDILIIDNADIPGGSFMDIKKDPVYQELCGLPLRLVFTTRMQDRDGIELRAMENSTLYQIFRRHEVDLTRSKMDALIAAVNAHTMTVDLMARTLDESWEEVTPEMILEAMAKSTLQEADYPEVYNDRDPEQRKIYAHLRSLFNLSNIPEDGRQALRCATLLPPGGMDPALFLRGLSREEAGAIKLLEKQGWVRRAKHLLTIHPVVRLVCRTELEPTDEKCRTFMDRLWDWYDEKKYDHVKFRQLGELFSGAADDLADTDGTWALRAGRFWNELGQAQRALNYDLKGLTALKQRVSGDSPELAVAYNDVGYTYGSMGNQDDALEYLKKALEMHKGLFLSGHPDTARIYSNIGRAYERLGQFRKALEYLEEALRIREMLLPPEHQSVARSYNNIGNVYRQMHEYELAIGYMQKGMYIRTNSLFPEHPDIAISYRNLGLAYSDLGNNEKALEYVKKALHIQEQVLPPLHPSIARTSNDLASVYSRMGEHIQAQLCVSRTMEIAQKSLPAGHPYLERYRRNAEEIERAAQQARSGE